MNPTSEIRPLAGLLFAPGEEPDPLIAALVADFPHLRIAGLIQRPVQADSCECRDLLVRSLSSGREHKITQDLGPAARGCRLDSAALADLAGALMSELDSAPDLLILNRFGKSEAEGSGLRQVLERALIEGIPVLAPVSARQHDLWRAYAGDLADTLPCEAAALRAWITAVTTGLRLTV